MCLMDIFMRNEGEGRSGGAAGGSSATEDNHRFSPETSDWVFLRGTRCQHCRHCRDDSSAFLRRRVTGTAVGGASSRSRLWRLQFAVGAVCCCPCNCILSSRKHKSSAPQQCRWAVLRFHATQEVALFGPATVPSSFSSSSSRQVVPHSSSSLRLIPLKEEDRRRW